MAGQVELSTEYADYLAVLTFAQDRSLREDMSIAYFGKAWPDNDGLLREILLLRREKALLLGYPDWPSYDAALKMVNSGEAVAELIEQVADLVRPSAARDYAALLDRKRRDLPDATDLDDADRRYYVATLGKERFDVDAELVRSYLHFPKALAGLLDVTGRLFGLTYLPVTDLPLWDDEVRSYDVVDTATGARLGRMHLDLHPREGKYSWFAQFDLVKGVRGRQLPEGVLVCTSPTGRSHTTLTILFHEFGHLLHHMIGGHQAWVGFSGVATEWDFVEAPLQMSGVGVGSAVLACFATTRPASPFPRPGRPDARGRRGRAWLGATVATVPLRGRTHPPPRFPRYHDRRPTTGGQAAPRPHTSAPYTHGIPPPEGVLLGLLHLRLVVHHRQGLVHGVPLGTPPALSLANRYRGPGARPGRLPRRGRPGGRVPRADPPRSRPSRPG